MILIPFAKGNPNQLPQFDEETFKKVKQEEGEFLDEANRLEVKLAKRKRPSRSTKGRKKRDP